MHQHLSGFAAEMHGLPPTQPPCDGLGKLPTWSRPDVDATVSFKLARVRCMLGLSSHD